MHSKFHKTIDVLLVLSLATATVTACSPKEVVEETTVETEEEIAVILTPANDPITTSVTLEDCYHTEIRDQVLPDLRFDSSYIDDVSQDNNAYVCTLYQDGSSIISYKNLESGSGLDFSIVENPERTSYLSLRDDSIYCSQIKDNKLYVSKCTFDNGSLGNNYYYVINDLPYNDNSEVFLSNGVYYVITSDGDINSQEIREYVFEDFGYGEEIEPSRKTDTVSNFIGLVEINNNVYAMSISHDTDVIYYSVNDMLNGQTAETYTYDELTNLYEGSASEFVNLGNKIVYIDSQNIEELNIRKPVGFTTMYSPMSFDVNRDGSIFMCAYNGVYEVVAGEVEAPELTEVVYNGHYDVLWNPDGVYETEDGIYATFISTEPYVLEEADLDVLCENAEVTEEVVNGRTMRTIVMGDETFYAFMIDSVRWKLYYSPDQYLDGRNGGDYRIIADTFTVRLSDDITYGMVGTPEDEESLTETYMLRTNADANITIRNGEVTAIEFVLQD